ncbi:hypothetical protein ALO42_102301 [Pseudomonas syringae pv. atrofaciens]|nr:hypothetical protein ALO42_102301 [Pseudomonas syringae pv. atrofaciens]RMP56728.1 hypothetical protein ALQ20_102705 [Pseudomonas syringae pv. atrofaciens]
MLSALRMTEEGSMELRCHCRQRQHEKAQKGSRKMPAFLDPYLMRA